MPSAARLSPAASARHSSPSESSLSRRNEPEIPDMIPLTLSRLGPAWREDLERVPGACALRRQRVSARLESPACPPPGERLYSWWRTAAPAPSPPQYLRCASCPGDA